MRQKMRKNAKKTRKSAKNEPKTSQKGAYPKRRRSPRTPVAWSFKLGKWMVSSSRVHDPSRWGEDPRALGRSAKLRETPRGSWHREYAPAGPNHAKHFQNLSHNLPKSIQKPSKPSENLPKTLPEPSKIGSRSIQKASWSPYWVHAWKKLDFECPKNGQEAAKSAQKRPKIVPNPSQMKPKTLPNPLFEAFCGFFLPFKICIDFLSFFSCFFVDFFKLEPLILLIFPRENATFCKIDVFKKNAKNPSKNFPKSIKNPPKIDQKSKKIDKKSFDGLRSRKNAKKMRKNAKKWPT